MVRQTLSKTVNPEKRDALSSILTVWFFVLLTALCAKVAFPLPFTPVPVTLQVFSVFLVGLMTTPLESFSAMVLYVGGGALGLPWFANFGSFATSGYLVGFVFAAPLCSWARQRVGSGVACLMALFVIYMFGVSFLCVVTGINTLKGALLGALPFIPFDFVKALAAIEVSKRLEAHDNP